MAYATAEELEEHLGADRYLDLADRDRSGAADAEAVTQALDAASSLLDSYASRYLPIAAPYPEVIVEAIFEIATYKLAGNRATTEERQKYEDVLGWLRDIGKRLAHLPLPEGGGSAPASSADLIVDAPEAKYRFDQTRRIV